MIKTAEEYIERQNSPQKEICTELRKLILKTFPGIKEEMKMGVPWYGGRYYLVAFGDHVNLGVSIEGLSKKDIALFDGTSKYMKHLKFHPEKELDKERITMLLMTAKKSKCSCPLR